MSTTIGEPFLLSSYGLSKSLPKYTGDLNRGPSYVTVTFADGTKGSDGFATITAQGDGVHVLDVGLSMLRIKYINILTRSLQFIPLYHILLDHQLYFPALLSRELQTLM